MFEKLKIKISSWRYAVGIGYTVARVKMIENEVKSNVKIVIK